MCRFPLMFIKSSYKFEIEQQTALHRIIEMAWPYCENRLRKVLSKSFHRKLKNRKCHHQAISVAHVVVLFCA